MKFSFTLRQPALILLAAIQLILAPRSSAQSPVRFAVIGDYGFAGQAEADVAALVKGWNPDFIITVGDNNYESGSTTTIDQNIGQYYHEFIFPYSGAYGAGATVNRFFPALGNHDWIAAGATPYLNYFELPNNERYYDFVRGPVHFFVIDSDTNEPDGRTSLSTQAQWLKSNLASSTARWRLVYFHHPPYSSGTRHGSLLVMRWPFRQWGATAVLAGHEHDYERLTEDNLLYLVNGLGGRSTYPFGAPIAGSQLRYNADYGAMLVDADTGQITFRFITRTGASIDSVTIVPPPKGVTFDLAGGWNMVSLPVTVPDPRASTLFPTAISRAFNFDGRRYLPSDSMRNGAGYWVKFASSQTAGIAGDSVFDLTVEVSAGWNMIGSLSEPVITSTIVQVPPGIIVSQFFGYEGRYAGTGILYPGKSYWVKVRQAGQLILSSGH